MQASDQVVQTALSRRLRRFFRIVQNKTPVAILTFNRALISQKSAEKFFSFKAAVRAWDVRSDFDPQPHPRFPLARRIELQQLDSEFLGPIFYRGVINIQVPGCFRIRHLL